MAKTFIIGSGALNWDLFFAVKEIEGFSFEGIYFQPGGEWVLERKVFLSLLEKLKKEGNFLFEGGGGSAANTIYALAKAGFKTSFISCCGEDSFGEKVIRELKEAGVDTSHIKRYGETSLALILLDKKKDRAIVVSPGSAEKALESFELKDLPEGLYHLTSFASPEGEAFHKQLLQKLKTKISFDPGVIYSSKGKTFLSPFIEKTCFLFITEDELKRSGFTKEELFERGIKYLFVKKGKKGAELFGRGLIAKSSVYPAKQIIDNTGAGDYFNAGVLAGLTLGLSPDKALELGLFSASVSLRDFGRRGVLSQAEFKNFLSRLK